MLTNKKPMMIMIKVVCLDSDPLPFTFASCVRLPHEPLVGSLVGALSCWAI